MSAGAKALALRRFSSSALFKFVDVGGHSGRQRSVGRLSKERAELLRFIAQSYSRGGILSADMHYAGLKSLGVGLKDCPGRWRA
jgi:hypothetical protein